MDCVPIRLSLFITKATNGTSDQDRKAPKFDSFGKSMAGSVDHADFPASPLFSHDVTNASLHDRSHVGRVLCHGSDIDTDSDDAEGPEDEFLIPDESKRSLNDLCPSRRSNKHRYDYVPPKQSFTPGKDSETAIATAIDAALKDVTKQFTAQLQLFNSEIRSMQRKLLKKDELIRKLQAATDSVTSPTSVPVQTNISTPLIPTIPNDASGLNITTRTRTLRLEDCARTVPHVRRLQPSISTVPTAPPARYAMFGLFPFSDLTTIDWDSI